MGGDFLFNCRCERKERSPPVVWRAEPEHRSTKQKPGKILKPRPRGEPARRGGGMARALPNRAIKKEMGLGCTAGGDHEQDNRLQGP